MSKKSEYKPSFIPIETMEIERSKLLLESIYDKCDTILNRIAWLTERIDFIYYGEPKKFSNE